MSLAIIAVAVGLWAALETGRRDVLVGYLYFVAIATLVLSGLIWITDPCPACPEPLP